ncbi:DUF3027 domain-containing protein [uncultured Jatrophihabitans sp.]|uniref:DUF3027 domain-containing protein n=1 Tax=uncultured Jatrophihabitans sp. TaxID=1610747 RepID=UPI0035CBC2F0
MTSTEPAEDTRTELDAVLSAAVELARTAAREVGGEHVGEHAGSRAEPASDGAYVVTHAFASTLPGYVGWHWAVTLGRVDDDEQVTVDEVVLLPGDTALLAPAWVPWDERVQPGDLSPGDLLPPRADDPRLVPAYVDSDDPAVETVAFELGLGREFVMSRDGRLDSAERWYAGGRGPDSPMARQAPAHCGTCGFFLSLAGSLAAGFGVCGNEVTDSDGAVVSVEYGCGAHSGVAAESTKLTEAPELVWDDGDEITVNEVSPEPHPEVTEPAVESEGAADAPVPQHDGVAAEAEQETGD